MKKFVYFEIILLESLALAKGTKENIIFYFLFWYNLIE